MPFDPTSPGNPTLPGLLYLRRRFAPLGGSAFDLDQCGTPLPSQTLLTIMVKDARFFTKEAVRCWQLSRGCNDRLLVELGREFAQRALELGADPDDLPEEWVKSPAPITLPTAA